MTFLFLFLEAVADPGFHRRGANGGADLLFGQVSMKTARKWRKFGWGSTSKIRPRRSGTRTDNCKYFWKYSNFLFHLARRTFSSDWCGNSLEMFVYEKNFLVVRWTENSYLTFSKTTILNYLRTIRRRECSSCRVFSHCILCVQYGPIAGRGCGV